MVMESREPHDGGGVTCEPQVVTLYHFSYSLCFLSLPEGSV